MRQVVVTGGGTGIGLAIAEAFVEAGDAVTITGRRAGVLKEAAARLGAVGMVADAADPAGVDGMLQALPDRIDVLVNNAGGNTDFDFAEPEDLSGLAEQWRANFDSNVLSAVLTTTAVAPRLGEGGRVVLLGSIAARIGAGSYGAAKAALEAYTATAATELGPRGVTVNLVAPGLILDTEFFRGRLGDEGIASRVAATKNKRAGTPADVASTVRFLASAEAGHITGQVIHVNGGAYLGR